MKTEISRINDSLVDWSLSPKDLVPILRERAKTEPVWNPKPVDIAPGNDFSNRLQETIFSQLNKRLTHDAIGGKLTSVPDKNTPMKDRPNVITMFGSGELNSTLQSVRLYLTLPLPKPRFFLINSVPNLPDLDFHQSRWQLFTGACHNGVIFEGNPDGDTINKALWISMQGNHKIIEGPEDKVYDNVTRRILAHYGATFLENRGNTHPPQDVTWQSWVNSTVHQQKSEAAHTLGEHGIIQNEVELEQFGDSQQSEAILEALKKSAGIGESMRWQLVEIDGHWILAVTRSGGGKVEVSPNPSDGHLVPILNITADGYEVVNFPNTPITDYANGSVETHESGRTAIHSALAMNERAKNFAEAENWITSEIESNGSISTIPEGMSPMFTVGDHVHRFLSNYNPHRVERVHPDPRYYPLDQDYPCGSIEGARSLLSAIWLSSAFQDPGSIHDPLHGKLLVAELGGHGMMVYGNDRKQVTEALTNPQVMELKEPEWV